MKLLFADIPKHRLPAFPVQPDRAEIEQKQKPCAKQSQIAIQTAEAAGMNRPARLGGCQAYGFARINAVDDPGRYSFGHGTTKSGFQAVRMIGGILFE